jgi:hypothetical protein
MPRGKITAIITGAISLLVAIAYLVLVQVLDFRGEMKPAPISQTPTITNNGIAFYTHGSTEQQSITISSTLCT